MVRDLRPEWVIHCAARPTVDWCEQHPEQAAALNLDATLVLARECAKVGAGLAFISTDYVFDGEAGPYAEGDAVRPINVYGRLKLDAEAGIRGECPRHVIVRTTNVYGYDPLSKNFVMGVLPRVARGELVAVAEDQMGTPTLVDDFSAAVLTLLRRGFEGTIHVAGPEHVDRLHWARAAALAFDLPPDRFVGKTTAELAQRAPRPLRSGLRTELLQGILRTPLRGLQDGLSRMRQVWGATPPVAEW